MAKASIIVACSECGREYKVEKKCYNRRDADNFEAWIASQKEHYCPECYAKIKAAERQAERDAENKRAAEASADLPSLEGSEKQVAWAITIRANALAKCKVEFRVAIAKQRMSAKWWIDNRFKAVNIGETAALMIAEDYGIPFEDARSNSELGREWAAKICA